MTEMKQTRKIEVKPDFKLILSSDNFPVRIRSREEQVVALNFEMEFKQAAGKEITFEDMVDIDYLKDENVLKIAISSPQDLRTYKARIDLEIPRSTAIQAKMENGSIKVSDLQGEQKFVTENGAIKLRNVQGRLDCQSENGPLILESCDGDFLLSSENGSIKSQSCRGNFKIQTENGSIKLKKCAGNLTSETENGTVRILKSDFQKADLKSQNGGIMYEFPHIDKGQFSFSNLNGRIHLIIPEELDYTIKAMNKMGRFHVSLPGDYERQQSNDNHILELIKGAGNVKIDIQNEFGSINLVSHTGNSFDFNLNGISQIFDNVINRIPDDIDIDTEKIKSKLEKAKTKIKEIKIPEPAKIQKQIDKAMNEVNKEIRKLKIDIDIDDLKEKANEAISSMVSTVKDKMKDEGLSASENKEVNERSKHKILEMVQEGKITVDEAEKLIEAMEE